MTGARQRSELAVRDAFLQDEGALMRRVLAAGQDRRRTGDLLEMPLPLGLLNGAELVDDGFDIGLVVALGEKLGEVMRHRCRAEGSAQILEGIVPAVIDALAPV